MGRTASRDKKLISQIQSGNMESMDELIELYFPLTYRRVRRMVPLEDAEDVTQDIFMNLVSSIDSFKGKSAFSTWFNRIIFNRVADYHRKMFRYKKRFVPEDEGFEYEISEEANSDLEAADILMKLPKPYRKVLFLKFFHNLSFGEIASELDMNYEAVRSRYRRGVQYAAAKIEPKMVANA
ncbi:sigma-70 family RNA polymerase sigma factor [Candidatus Poribacteria bacterium]|nr:sigma-70 family RNA polymerase sigma factor [Candidatus Poribacteria bacterium]